MKMKNIGEIQKPNCTTNFTVIPNEICQSSTLSAVAKTILIYLLSLPSDWSIVKTNMNKQLGMGRYAFDQGWKELLTDGYIHATKHFNAAQKTNYYSYRVTGYRLSDERLSGNLLVNKEEKTKEIKTKDKIKKDSISNSINSIDTATATVLEKSDNNNKTNNISKSSNYNFNLITTDSFDDMFKDILT